MIPRKAMRTVITLLAAMIAGVAASEFWRISFPLTTGGDETQLETRGVEESIRPMISFNDVYEYTRDQNDDGRVDRWVTVLREHQTLSLKYIVDDTNLDGSPDMMRVTFGPRTGGYSLRDDDQDGMPDLQVFLAPDLKAEDPNRWYNYYDLDMDGQVDLRVLMSNSDDPMPIENHLIIDSRWVLVDAEKGGNFTGGLYIFEDNESVHVRFNFDKGIWERTYE